MLSILRIALALTAGHMVYDTSLLSPDVQFAYDGNLVGLCDLQHRELTPAKFSRIDYVGHGFFLAWSANLRDKYAYGDERILLNKNGKTMDVLAPLGGKLVQLFWLGDDADKNNALEFDELPEAALFVFSKDGKFGLCNAKGVIVLPASYGFIGRACKGKAFITDKVSFSSREKNIFIFDCREKRIDKLALDKLPLTNVIHADRLCISDGLFAYPNIYNSFKTNASYLDETATPKITLKATRTGPFIRGMASIVLPGPPRDRTGEAIINRSGEVISPPNLEVQDFFGDYAVARDLAKNPYKYGIIDRRFKFVVEPIYARLYPQEQQPTSFIASAAERYEIPASFYLARESDSQSFKLITATGRVLLTLPQSCQLEGPLADGTLACSITTPNGKTGLHLDMNGKPLADQNKIEQEKEGHHIWYRAVSSDRAFKIVKIDNDRFDSEYWKARRSSPVSRRRMFARFLKEYNLIAMSRNEVIRLLGTGVTKPYDADCYGYVLEEGCPSAEPSPMLVVYFKDDKVQSWFIDDDGKKSKLVTTNVVFSVPDNKFAQSYARSYDLVPKR